MKRDRQVRIWLGELPQDLSRANQTIERTLEAKNKTAIGETKAAV